MLTESPQGVYKSGGQRVCVKPQNAHLLYLFLSFFLSIDTESIKFRSSSQVWWVAKF